MEMMLVVLSTAIGTIVGVTAGLLMINRNKRGISPTDAHLAALKQGYTAGAPGAGSPEVPPAANPPGVSLEDLRKLVDGRDDALRQCHEDLRRAQSEIEQAVTEVRQEAQQRAAAEQHSQELAAQVATLTRQVSDQEAQIKEQAGVAGRLAEVTAELAETRRSGQEEGSYRSTLETQLGAERDHNRQLMNQIAALERELDDFELRVSEQRQSALKGLELLGMAQNSFASVFETLSRGANAHNGNGHVEAPVPVAAAPMPVAAAPVPVAEAAVAACAAAAAD